jgi:hypothetical protein
MKKHFGLLAALCLLFTVPGFTGSNTAAAQEQPGVVTPPPKVLVIMREFLKPGKAGSLHQKTESAFVQAFTQAQWPTHYMAMDSLSGRPRALFFVGYGSFEEWQKDMDAAQKNTTLSAAMDSASIADGELLDSEDSGTFVYRDDLSLSGPVDIAHMRYMQITMVRVRTGHGKNWDALVKMHNSVYGNLPNAHWAVYEKWYGAGSGDEYLVITAMKSLAEVDQRQAASKQIRSSMSADQKTKMADLAASTIASAQTNLFLFDPKMSYAPDSWVKADPDFWGQK